MDYFLRLFGSVTIESAVFVLAALFFLWKTYKKVEKYFSEKALAEEAKDTKMAEVMDQVNKYPLWHQQSLDIQKKFTQEIEGLRKGQQENNKRLEKMEEENRRRERNKLRDRILQSYRYYTSPEKNPMKAWSEMEADAFWKIFKDYEDLDGDGYVHSEVQPAMNDLEKIPIHETEKITELMKSRR